MIVRDSCKILFANELLDDQVSRPAEHALDEAPGRLEGERGTALGDALGELPAVSRTKMGPVAVPTEPRSNVASTPSATNLSATVPSSRRSSARRSRGSRSVRPTRAARAASRSERATARSAHSLAVCSS